MNHITTEIIYIILFALWALVQYLPNSGSAGQDLPGLYIDQPAPIKSKADIMKTAVLCCVIHTNHGAAETIEATTAPAPKLTKAIGKAQHKRVEVVVNNTNHPNLFVRFLSCDIILFFALLRCHQHLKHMPYMD